MYSRRLRALRSHGRHTKNIRRVEAAAVAEMLAGNYIVQSTGDGPNTQFLPFG